MASYILTAMDMTLKLRIFFMGATNLKVELPASLSGNEAKVFLAIKLYEVGKVSLGQAAKIAGHSKRAFMEILGHHRVPIFDYSPDELRQEISQ